MTEMDGLGQAKLVRDKQVTASELLDAAVSRAQKAQARINCFAALFPDLAREQIARGGLEGPYAGVPFVTKDLAVGVKGAPLTGGSRAYRDVVSADDTTLVKRYRQAGLVFFGSTTTPDRLDTFRRRMRSRLTRVPRKPVSPDGLGRPAQLFRRKKA